MKNRKNSQSSSADGVRPRKGLDVKVVTFTENIGGREVVFERKVYPEWVYGIGNVEEMFGVSYSVAVRYCRTFLAPACGCDSRRVVLHTPTALRLYYRHLGLSACAGEDAES